jgi:hypothetical protein
MIDKFTCIAQKKRFYIQYPGYTLSAILYTVLIYSSTVLTIEITITVAGSEERPG